MMLSNRTQQQQREKRRAARDCPDRNRLPRDVCTAPIRRNQETRRVRSMGPRGARPAALREILIVIRVFLSSEIRARSRFVALNASTRLATPIFFCIPEAANRYPTGETLALAHSEGDDM